MNARILVFIILVSVWIFLPLIPIFVVVQCVTIPCYPVINFVSIIKLGEYLLEPYINIPKWIYIIIGVELIILYFISNLVTHRLRKFRKS